MDRERQAGATFALADIGWVDFESRSKTPIKAGTYRYATEADAILCACAVGDAEPLPVHGDPSGAALRWADIPETIHRHYDRVLRGEAIFAAWNAGFDRAIWNYATVDFPPLEPHHIIDVMAQGVASGLAPDLDTAAKQSHSTHKVGGTGKLIDLFCVKGASPREHPAEWLQFALYAKGDVEAMRSIFKGTRQLPLAEWREYWAMEAVNARGVRIDLAMVTHAARLAELDRGSSRDELTKITANAVTSVDQVKRLTEWLLPRLPVEGRDILLKREEEIDEETGKVTRPAKYALRRGQVERLIVLNKDATIDRVLQVRLYGGSKTPAKFSRMLQQQVDGVLFGQYVFNGAAQTGRASSKGVQVHNLARDTLEGEPELIDALLNGCSHKELAAIGPDPVARKLSLLIRPCFVPRGDNVFVWSDWSQIEARIVPWLCDHLPGAQTRLQIFRAIDADPSLPDLYTRSAAEISGLPIAAVTKAIRQRGKVAELALGFCGGVNSLQKMGASYGLYLDDLDAKLIVDRWRAANPWAIGYSKELWTAMEMARDAPNRYFTAGRVGFLFKPDYLKGSLLCRLPSGRWLTYRAMRPEWIDILDDDDNVIDRRRELTFARGYGRIKLWPGLFVENFTQATAADVLRGTLARLEMEYPADMPVRLHTHDEILIETAQRRVELVQRYLNEIMRRGFEWSDGLPLMSEETAAYYYTKHEGSHGL